MMAASAFAWVVLFCFAWFSRDILKYRAAVETFLFIQLISQYGAVLHEQMPEIASMVFKILRIFVGDFSIYESSCLDVPQTFVVYFVGNLGITLGACLIMVAGCFVAGLIRTASE